MMNGKNGLQTSDEPREERLIPYPQGFGRVLLRLPIRFYEAGLGNVMNAAHIMILGTRGRKSGQTRYTAIEYRRHGSKLYIVSAWGERPQWVRNLQASPEVLVQAGHQQFGGHAEVVTNSGEALSVVHLFRRRAPLIYDPLIAWMSARPRIDSLTLREVSREITIVRIDPIADTTDLAPLPVHTGWIMPTLMTLVAALLLLSGWAIRRARRNH